MACLVDVGRFAREGLRFLSIDKKLDVDIKTCTAAVVVFTERGIILLTGAECTSMCLLRSIFVQMT